VSKKGPFEEISGASWIFLYRMSQGPFDPLQSEKAKRKAPSESSTLTPTTAKKSKTSQRFLLLEKGKPERIVDQLCS
jgi:hypothetical protein